VDLRELMLRRDVLTALIATLAAPQAWAGAPPNAVQVWMRRVGDLRDALREGEIDQRAWLAGVERANAAVPIQDLAAHLNLDSVRRLPRSLSSFRDIAADGGATDDAFIRVFGMRRGACLLPHVHNGMVSAHLVVSGAFHVRTHDRVRDLDDAVVLRPTRDEIVGVGGMVMMSDTQDNQHWLVAREDRSFTLDIAVFQLPHAHGLEAKFENTLLVDPLQRPERDGTIVAPLLSFEAAMARFGGA